MSEAFNARQRVHIPKSGKEEDYEEWLALTSVVGALSEAIQCSPAKHIDLRNMICEAHEAAWGALMEADQRWRGDATRGNN